jgi:hypothetical protein
MATFTFMYTHGITYRAYFEAESLEEAEAKLQAISNGESKIWLDQLPEYSEKLRGEEAQIDLDTIEELA